MIYILFEFTLWKASPLGQNKVLKLFLPLEEKNASNNEYFTTTYYDVLNVLEFIIQLYKDRITTEVKNFIGFYIKILKEKIVIDEELK